MSSIHYCAAWTECGCLLTCGHSHTSVGEAATCVCSAGAYVVAIDAGTIRSLNAAEEAEFQIADYRPPVPIAAARTRAIEIATEIDSRYALMTRIRVGGQWTWTSWMCFGTHAEASTHARDGDKVVRFRSAEWHALRRQTMIDPPSHACADTELPPESQNETLVEFVLRLLSTIELELELDSKAQEERINSEGRQQDDSQNIKRA